MLSLPRLVVSAPSTGQGKTTIATGLMAALRAAGHQVSGHKVGPDYIDPGYHALATGRPGRNLDPHLVGEDRIVPLLLHGAAGADVAVIEGVMGLHDGRLGSEGFASTAHVARLIGSPVVLVLDVARLSRTAAAIAAGVARFDPTVTVAGVVLNRTGSVRNDNEIVSACEGIGLPVLGLLPRQEELAAPSRHLGLVPEAERSESAVMIEILGQQVGKHLDLDALLAVAAGAPALDTSPWDPAQEVRDVGAGRPVVAVAGGKAFTFCYSETRELLQAAGCEVVTFDPLHDPALPRGTRAIYLGGGFPEVYAVELAANHAMLADLRRAVTDGLPTVAECAGLLYLARSLDGHDLAGVVPATAAMTPRLTLRYPAATAVADSLLTRAGDVVTGHEFHRTTTDPPAGDTPAWTVDGSDTGFATATVHASYLHTHWAGHPQLAQRFAEAAGRTTPHPAAPSGAATVRTTPAREDPASDGTTGPDPVTDPLRHHGDAETRDGLLDFAVNVFDGSRPGWLDDALRSSLDRVGEYPDPSAARTALARTLRLPDEEILPTAGAAEAFTLVAGLTPWRLPVVVHPQFTEPHAALEQAGHQVTVIGCPASAGFALDPGAVPEQADLVVVGNPTNPTGVLHPARAITALCRPDRLVVVDEAFMDAVPGEAESLLGLRLPGLVVIRSLTKTWSIPGVRAGYLTGEAAVVAGLASRQPPWSVSASAIAAIVACCAPEAADEAARRARDLGRWRDALQQELTRRRLEFVPSSAPFVLARLGAGAHAALRDLGVAVRRADTFPGLDHTWVRIAVRPPGTTGALLEAIDRIADPPAVH